MSLQEDTTQLPEGPQATNVVDHDVALEIGALKAKKKFTRKHELREKHLYRSLQGLFKVEAAYNVAITQCEGAVETRALAINNGEQHLLCYAMKVARCELALQLNEAMLNDKLHGMTNESLLPYGRARLASAQHEFEYRKMGRIVD